MLFKIAGVGILISVFSHSVKAGRQRRYGALMYFSRLRDCFAMGSSAARTIVYYRSDRIQAVLGVGVMEIVQIIGLGFIVTLLILIIRSQRPEMAVQLSITLATIIFLLVLSKINVVLNLFRDLAEKANVSQLYLNTILKNNRHCIYQRVWRPGLP